MRSTNPEERTPIYEGRANVYEREWQRLHAWRGDQSNKNTIVAYQQSLFVKGTQKLRIAKLIGQLRRICDHLPTILEKATKRDIEAVVAWINQNDSWTVVTQADYRRAVKSFYNWFEDEDARFKSGDITVRETARTLYQYLKKYVSVSYKPRSVEYSAILNQDDYQQLLQSCTNSMERAIIAVMHETGCRVGELLNIRLRDIEHKEKHAMLRLDGKTGQRRVPIIQSLPWVHQWIANHPFKDNSNALLWISTHNGHYGSALRYIGIVRILQRVSKKAGLTKKHNAHWFRHSRATLLVTQRYNDQIQCKFMGWVEGSKQQRTYVHIGAEQVEDAVLKNHGLINETKNTPQAQFCVCGTTNDSEARYCYKCGNALSVATLIEDEAKKKAAIDDDIMWFATTVMTNPELRKQFEEHKKNGGTKL